MAQWLGICIALAEDMSSVSSTYAGQLTMICS